MSQNGAYPYEYIDTWKKFSKISLHEKIDFYSHLNMEDIADADYTYAKRICKDFEIKNSQEHHDLYVQIDTLLLADIFEDFQNCLESIFWNVWVWFCSFSYCTRTSMQSSCKK